MRVMWCNTVPNVFCFVRLCQNSTTLVEITVKSVSEFQYQKEHLLSKFLWIRISEGKFGSMCARGFKIEDRCSSILYHS